MFVYILEKAKAILSVNATQIITSGKQIMKA